VTIGSLDAIRLLLDKAGTVDEAIALLGAYNIDWEGGPPLHYLIADAAGHSAVIEFLEGEMQVLPSEEPWQVATNFLLTGLSPERAVRSCRRFATAYETLERAEGSLPPAEAMDLLEGVSQDITMWSVVYGMTGGDIRVSVGRDFEDIHQFRLPMDDS
jgi:choloylglycine hydrolase